MKKVPGEDPYTYSGLIYSDSATSDGRPIRRRQAEAYAEARFLHSETFQKTQNSFPRSLTLCGCRPCFPHRHLRSL